MIDLAPEEAARREETAARADKCWRQGYLDVLATRGHLRVIQQALTEKKNVLEIASQLGISEERVEELAGVLADGQKAEESAYEVIVRAHIEGTSRRELIKALADWEWPEVAYDPFADVEPATWYRTHRDAVISKLMTAREVAEIEHLRSGAPGPYVPPVEPTAEEEEAHLRGRLIEIHARMESRRNAVVAVAAGEPIDVVAKRFGLMAGLVGSDVEDVKADPEYLDPEPDEIIEKAWLSGTDRRELVEVLCGIVYTDDLYAPDGQEGMISGTWSDVVRARWRISGPDMLSEAEYNEVERRRKQLVPSKYAKEYG